ncbi:hypothetical protein MMC17_000690 [Xylographa soralifera]|nr:hypothetical protein [Xylographa soralifera]
MTPKTSTGTHHRRSHSWPPFRVHSLQRPKDIDENPFAFFITTTVDSEEIPEGPMSAGIEKTPRSRSLSPLRLRAKHNPDLASLTVPNPFSRLKRWIQKMEKQYFHQGQLSPLEVPQNTPVSLLPRSPASTPSRGRGSIRGSPRSLRSPDSRSHSGRPRVWREPSEDIWPVVEEQEDIGLGISL